MTFAQRLHPRDPATAARMAVTLILAAAAASLLFSIISPPEGGAVGTVVGYLVPASCIVIAAGIHRAGSRVPGLVLTAVPLIGILAVLSLDLATHDGSAAGQVFLCFPVLYAASQLRPVAAYATTALAIAADAVVVLVVLPLDVAANDFVYVTIALLAITALLVHAGRVQDALIAKLTRQAAVDPLTGLVTRRVLDDAARSALTGATSAHGTALILLDVDQFKHVNDDYGHPVGDLALVHIAQVLSAHSRPDSVICRLGGDEIAVLLPGCSRTAALRRAESFVEAVRGNPLELEDGTLLALSVSAGVAHVPTDASELRDLYSTADAALYSAKMGGRDRVGMIDRRADAEPTAR